jgi:hypothetical protein
MFLSAREARGEARRGGSCFDAQDLGDLGPDTIDILESFAGSGSV